MKDFWNSRFSAAEYAYGTEPNQFFQHALKEIQPTGKIFLPAEGEGRNAVFAASLGLDVLAFDISEEGKKKADLLAKEKQVSINYQVGNLNQLGLEPNSFDVIGLIYAHFETYIKVAYHKEFISLLKPGGFLIFEAFSKNHIKFQKINPNAGGPKNAELLFSLDEIRTLFDELEEISLAEKVIDLEEGPFHRGKASVIRYIGQKI
jgi:2-polyprenyl-3-methyl-5-hydroxy-6-metoxy-1,4-benzoquinol methylase